MNSSSPDVVVVGAGIIGASISWRLAQAGMSVTLVDAGKFGSEASWAGAGMLAPGGEIRHRSAWSDFAVESLRQYKGFIAELEEEGGAEIDYRQCGAVQIACTTEEWDDLRERADTQAALGIPSETIDAGQVRQLVPPLRKEVVGARFFPEDSVVDPRDVMRALNRACAFREVEIREGFPVNALRASADSVEVSAGTEVLKAARAVLAAGAWSGQVSISIDGAPCLIPATYPVKGHLIAYRMERDTLGPILRYGHTYVVQRANGYTIAGSSEERIGLDREISSPMVHDIASRATDLIPELRSALQPDSWIGFRPATASLEPEIRRLLGANIWLCYGHYRNGILLAPASARRVSREIIASSGKDSTSLLETR